MSPDPLAAVAALPGIPAAAERARRAVDDLLGHRALRRSCATVTVECSLRSAVAAALLQAGPHVPDGWDLDVVRERLRSGDLLAGEPVVSRDEATLRGAVRMSVGTGTLLHTWEVAPLQALARLHVLGASDVLTAAQLGRPRAPDAAAEEEGGLGGAPATAENGTRLSALPGLLGSSTTAPAIVVAAVVHGEILALRPFAWGNVLVALAAQRLVLASRGVDPRAVSVPEAGHLELGAPAYDAAQRGYAGGSPEGVAAWVVHCARAVEIGAREGLAVAETLAGQS